MKKNIKSLVIGFAPILIMIVAILLNSMPNLSDTLKFILMFVIFFTSIINIIYNSNLNSILRKLVTIVSYILAFGLLCYSFLDKYDLIKFFSSVTATKELVLSTGAFGSFVFIFIQTAQVVFLPIPAVALMLVGIVIYGPLKTAIYCIIGVLLGSYISFMVGKTFGQKFISWIFGEEKVNKYAKLLEKNTKYILTIIFLFPFFPDDLFCMLAGITSMSFKDFFIITTLVRPISIIIVCLFGGGVMNPFKSITTTLIFIGLLLLVIVSMIVFFKKNKEIRTMILSLKK